MDTVILLALVVVAASAGWAWTRSGRSGAVEVAQLSEQLRGIAIRLESDTAQLSARLEGIDTRMNRTQAAGNDLARDVFESLGEVRRATEAVAEQARSFASLQDILAAPKPRGGLGEALLEELLRQVLPPSAYEMQHRFSDGRVVDAAVRAGGRLVCIDAKFPLNNHRRICDATDEPERAAARRAFAKDVEKHIADISTRYIVPDEGTLDLAVMYVPAEGVYGEVLRLDRGGRDLFDLAIERRVIPMSPLTMYAYLQTLLLGLRYLKIEQGTEGVLRNCERLQRDVARFSEHFDTLGRHLCNAQTRYEEGARSLEGLRHRVESTVTLAEAESPAPALRPVEVARGRIGAEEDPRSG